jgi:GNAT superfamily N-acetyltransferase
MQIRKASVDDAAPLTALLQEIGWFELLNKETLAAATRRVKSQLEHCLADGSHSIFVAETADGVTAGYVSVHWLPYLFLPGPEGFVSELFVRDAARGQGIGRRLLQTVEAEARTRGCSRLAVINFRNRESYQRRFYVKLGWAERVDAANFIYPIF